MTIKNKMLSNEYEYRNVIELTGTASKYIRVPSSLIIDTEMSDKRVGVFAYLHIYKGIHNKLYISVPELVKWAGYVHDTHKGGNNDKFIDALDELNDRGYLTYYDNITRSSCTKMEVDTNLIYEECLSNGFALLYVDEIEKILTYKSQNHKDTYMNSMTLLLVFAFLRKSIFRTPNRLKPEERSPEGIEKRKERCIEAYANSYKEISYMIGLSPKTVARAVQILEELNLIVVAEPYRLKNEEGCYRTPYTIFANYEKREDSNLLVSGIEYAKGEIAKKAEKISDYRTQYNINWEKFEKKRLN